MTFEKPNHVVYNDAGSAIVSGTAGPLVTMDEGSYEPNLHNCARGVFSVFFVVIVNYNEEKIM